MNLFQCLDAKPDTILDPTNLQTPLGRIQFEATFDGNNISDEPPKITYRLGSDGWLVCWHRADFDLELLVCRPLIQASDDYPVTDCWAGL